MKRDEGLHSVGTRGRCGEGRGPCACPGCHAIPLGFHDIPGQSPSPQTSTRPPHPPHTAPCPYRKKEAFLAITAFDRQKSSDSTYVQTLPQSCKIAEDVSHYFSHKERKT